MANPFNTSNKKNIIEVKIVKLEVSWFSDESKRALALDTEERLDMAEFRLYS